MHDSDSRVTVPFVRNPYNYDAMAVSDETGLFCSDPSRTSQSFAEESDINWIVDRFVKTGVPPDGMANPQFGDFTDLPSDYHSALNQIRNADAAFMTLPAKVRSEFDNDAGKLLAFMNDPKNLDRAVELGIIDGKDLSPAGGAAPKREALPAGGKSPVSVKPSKKVVSDGNSGGDEGDE